MMTPQPKRPSSVMKERPKPSSSPPAKQSLGRRNSTETLYIRTDMRAPDREEIVRCLSKALHVVLNTRQTSAVPKVKREIFSEEFYPLEHRSRDFSMIPTLDEVERLLSVVFEKQHLTAECAVMAAAYIDRLLTCTGMNLQPDNWRRILIVALLLADKVSEEMSVWNVDYVELFTNFTIEDLNQLELEFLTCLQFNLVLKPSVYARYFFELRSLSDCGLTLKPLDKATAIRLEARSHGVEEQLKAKLIKDQRSKSLMPYEHTQQLSLEEFRKYVTEKTNHKYKDG